MTITKAMITIFKISQINSKNEKNAFITYISNYIKVFRFGKPR